MAGILLSGYRLGHSYRSLGQFAAGRICAEPESTGNLSICNTQELLHPRASGQAASYPPAPIWFDRNFTSGGRQGQRLNIPAHFGCLLPSSSTSQVSQDRKERKKST